MIQNQPANVPEGTQQGPAIARGKQPNSLPAFWRSDSGAASIDWVILVIAIVAMVAAFFANFSPNFSAWITAMTF